MAENKFKVTQQADGKYKYTCSCGSEMYDNTRLKTSQKAPDLKCKDKNCTVGFDKKNDCAAPNAVWLTEVQKKKLNIPLEAQIKDSTPKAGGGTKTQGTGGKTSVGTDMQVSYYGAWAKDMAIYLAEKNNVKNSTDLQTLYAACLEIVGTSLKNHISKVVKTNPAAESESRPVDVPQEEEISLDGPSESVSVPSDIKIDDDIVEVDPLADSKAPASNPDDVDLSGLDDVDLG